MKSLESLDLSMNQLSGSIPESISALSSLSHLNLSYSNLSGPIPSGNQLQTFEDTSIYEGNPELCGPPIEKKCRGDEPSQTPAHAVSKDDDEGDDLEMSWFYIGMASGFFVGTLGVFSVLWFKKSWRYAYFQYAEDINDGFHVLKRKEIEE
ncbi:hypothetical protein IFM89_039006 [Coptis chinensis]|uniref:Uncharacterized protein n=1 Tax=Coptis chinensis TaxID=261450 RepID=A0A835IIP9_9MAGN|nr:hypothetical protein IFM89_039006 [Coptis chinensis]